MITKVQITLEAIIDAYRMLSYGTALRELYAQNPSLKSKISENVSEIEALHIAASMLLLPTDFAYFHNFSEAFFLALGISPEELFIELLNKGKQNASFTMSLKQNEKPKVPFHASGLHTLCAAGTALAITKQDHAPESQPAVLCIVHYESLSDSLFLETLTIAYLYHLPILFIFYSPDAQIDTITQNAIKPLLASSVEAHDFIESYQAIKDTLQIVRTEQKPLVIHAYGSNQPNPYQNLHKQLIQMGISEEVLSEIQYEAAEQVKLGFERAQQAQVPPINHLFDFTYSSSSILSEQGNKTPEQAAEVNIPQAALKALNEIMNQSPEAFYFGHITNYDQQLLSIFGEQRTLCIYGHEQYLLAAASGIAAANLKPILCINHSEKIGIILNQLFTQLAPSAYLTEGQYSQPIVIRLRVGAAQLSQEKPHYSVESLLCSIEGIKVVYPATPEDTKGLLKAAFYDPNPVIIMEHNAFYEPNSPYETLTSKEPSEDYIVPIGNASIFLHADNDAIENGESCLIITYGIGIHWSLVAAQAYKGKIEILDLRSLKPLDWNTVQERVKIHNRAIIVTEEVTHSTFAEGLAGRISRELFQFLDAPIKIVGSEALPVIPSHPHLQQLILPNPEKITHAIFELLNF